MTRAETALAIGGRQPDLLFSHHGAYDFDTILRTVRAAGAQATLVG